MPHSQDVAIRSSKMIMDDAFYSISKAHTVHTKHYLSNKVDMYVSTLGTEDKLSLGVTAALTAGVAIATIATGGIALPVLLGLGAAGWAMSKAIEEIGRNHNRVNRNWLQRYPAASSAANENHGAFLTVEAGDALRRAVDHYRMMIPITQEMLAAINAPYSTCEDALNHIKAVARYIHHSDKVRNYTLPVLDLLIFYLDQYEKLLDSWTDWERDLRVSLLIWFEAHGNDSCCPGGKKGDVCYAPFSGLRLNRQTHTLPAKRHPDATYALPATYPPVDAPTDIPDGVPVKELADGMKAVRAKVVAGMHLSASTTWNYSAERPATARVTATAPAAEHMLKRRLDAMLDAVWQQVDRPGYFARGTRRIEHWYTRHTTSEKVGAVISELAGVGSIFLPFMKNATALTALGRSAISSTVSGAVLVGDKVGLKALQGMDGKTFNTSLLEPRKIDAHVNETIRADAAGVEKLLPKLMLHFSKAAEAVASLAKAPVNIRSCNDAMALSTKAAEVMSQMAKVSRYAAPCVGIVDVLCKGSDAWSEREDEAWRHVEVRVGTWLAQDEAHETCRNDGKKCYGARHHRSGTNLIGRGGTWSPLTNDPHNPIT